MTKEELVAKLKKIAAPINCDIKWHLRKPDNYYTCYDHDKNAHDSLRALLEFIDCKEVNDAFNAVGCHIVKFD